MPELPEVETIARTLGPQIRGKRICGVEVLLPKALQHGAERIPLLAGAKIEEVSRRAKLLLVTVRPEQSTPALLEEKEGGSTAAVPEPEIILAFHLKMTGSFFVHPPNTPPLKHTRLIFDLEDGGRLFFDDTRTFGYCRIMYPHELPLWPFWAGLGPEPLGMPPEALAAHFARSFARRRCPVKNALLDQSVVAGVGNIYADESLFLAGILPIAKADRIPEPKLLRLAQALQSVLRQSIDECGSSVRDYRDALGNAGAFQNSFAVYGRKNENCRTCGEPLQSCRIAGRATVYCPVCQSGEA